MTRLVALYRHPDDEQAFLNHYENIHIPLVRAIPNLKELKVSRVTQRLMGEPAYLLIAEMIFDTQAGFAEAMTSRENRAAGADLNGFAAGLVTLFVVDG